MKVVKFGGTSVSSAEQIKKVFQIVTADPERKIVVVSAPGKRKKDDIKVTDLLIKCGEEYCKTGNGKEAFWQLLIVMQKLLTNWGYPSILLIGSPLIYKKFYMGIDQMLLGLWMQ